MMVIIAKIKILAHAWSPAGDPWDPDSRKAGMREYRPGRESGNLCGLRKNDTFSGISAQKWHIFD